MGNAWLKMPFIVEKSHMEAKLTESFDFFFKTQGKNSKFREETKKLKQKTQGFGKSTWSTCRKQVKKAT